jgi:SAM-dependent methyltransferase
MTTGSDIIPLDWTETEKDARDEWPMATYMSAWRLFRRLSNENAVTAQHILSRRMWPRGQRDLHIVDFGCGEGLLIEALILASQREINTVHLVDIDPELLDQGGRRVENLGLTQNMIMTLGNAANVVGNVTRVADAALGVHLVYLLKELELKRFVADLPRGVPLYIVMDQETSIFSRLWEQTAPKYHRRTLNAHETIRGLAEADYIIERRDFDTHLSNPMGLRDDIRDSVLSLLCYTSFVALDQATQRWVTGTLTEYAAQNRVVCGCACYEIVRI